MKACRFFRKITDFLGEVVIYLLIAALLILAGCGIYSIWDANNVNASGSASRFIKYKPVEGNELSFEELQVMNPDVIGWLTIYGTEIDQPLLQGEDNQKYVNTAADGSFSLAGAIFLDASAEPDFSGINNPVYGHDMEDNAMFGQLREFKDSEFFDAHRYGNLYVNGRNYGIDIFEYAQADAYNDDIYNTAVTDKRAWLRAVNSVSQRQRDSGQAKADHFIMLVTCSSAFTNARDLVIACITNETFDDTFNTKIAEVTTEETTDSRTFLQILPLWIWGVLVFAVFGVALVCVKRHINKLEKSCENSNKPKNHKSKKVD